MIYQTQARHAEAVATLDSLLELDPRHPGALHRRALSRSELGDSNGALVDYARAIELQPRNLGRVYADRGALLVEFARYAQAFGDLDRALQLGGLSPNRTEETRRLREQARAHLR